MSSPRLLAEIARWGCGFWLLWRLPRCDGVRSGARQGVAIVVPARDEASTIGRLLASLKGQLQADDRVIVVDDDSTDGTAAAADAGGALVVSAPALPEGWTGKSWACATGAARAIGEGAETLVFLDADTRLRAGGLDRLLATFREAGGLLSVQPYHATERPFESLSAFFNVISMMGVGAFTPRRRAPRGAFGPCLVTSAADYRRVGGHAAVRADILDDVALAGRYRDFDLPVTVRSGSGTVDFRMYADGFGALVRGWTKNFGTGATRTAPVTVLLIVAWLSGCISAPFALFRGVGDVSGVAVYAAYAAQLAGFFRRVGRFRWWTAVAYPVALALFLLVFVRSLISTFIARTVEWKGRRVPVGAR